MFDDRQPITWIPEMVFGGLRRMQKSTVNAETMIYTDLVCRNSVPTSSLGEKYIAPCALGFRPRGLFLLCYTDLGYPVLLYIAQEASLLVGYNIRILVGLQDSNVNNITRGEFLVELDLLPSLRDTWGPCRTTCALQGC
jgi:hypothetical protein